MKKLTLIKVGGFSALIIVLPIGALGCFGSTELSSGKQNQDVKLLTGVGNDQVVWHIKNVTRVDHYIDEKTMNVVNGEGISIEGESASLGDNSPFFIGELGEKKKPIFVLVDTNGKQYKSQMEDVKVGNKTITGETDDFTVVFGITTDGSVNEAIKKWKDLTIADPDEGSKDLPGHQVSLGAFDADSNS